MTDKEFDMLISRSVHEFGADYPENIPITDHVFSDDFERRMKAVYTKKNKKSRLIVLRRISAAAAVLLIAVGAFVAIRTFNSSDKLTAQPSSISNSAAQTQPENTVKENIAANNAEKPADTPFNEIQNQENDSADIADENEVSAARNISDSAKSSENTGRSDYKSEFTQIDNLTNELDISASHVYYKGNEIFLDESEKSVIFSCAHDFSDASSLPENTSYGSADIEKFAQSGFVIRFSDSYGKFTILIGDNSGYLFMDNISYDISMTQQFKTILDALSTYIN